MSFLESIIAAVFCIFVVFIVLACLFALIKIFSFGISKIEIIGKKSAE